MAVKKIANPEYKELSQRVDRLKVTFTLMQRRVDIKVKVVSALEIEISQLEKKTESLRDRLLSRIGDAESVISESKEAREAYSEALQTLKSVPRTIEAE